MRKNARYTLKKALAAKISYAKGRAKKMELPFDITVDEMLDAYASQQGKCHYTGRPLDYKPGSPDTLSIDRVDSNRGYVKDNVVLCLWTINLMKQDLDLTEFVSMCKIIAERW